MQGRCLAVRFFRWLISHKPLLGSTQPVPTASLSQKGGRQAFSPSPPPPPRVLPALRRAGARRLSAAAWAPWGALGADTPFARPTAASPFSSCSLGCAGRARGLRLERQRAQPVVGTAQRNTNGRGLSALPRVTPPWERRAPGTKLSPSAGKQPRSLPASTRLPAPRYLSQQSVSHSFTSGCTGAKSRVAATQCSFSQPSSWSSWPPLLLEDTGPFRALLLCRNRQILFMAQWEWALHCLSSPLPGERCQAGLGGRWHCEQKSSRARAAAYGLSHHQQLYRQHHHYRQQLYQHQLHWQHRHPRSHQLC
ncbi:uncharacterized protein LOC122153675 [Tyto alba]|uniref:uncharacterized protein LOC122153675 n=1 Tax=Tyto alba TaxID=56313 RepID=UPI001C668006|nr:uncharacterized protein LOC122153675 [Tyto alba]